MASNGYVSGWTTVAGAGRVNLVGSALLISRVPTVSATGRYVGTNLSMSFSISAHGHLGTPLSMPPPTLSATGHIGPTTVRVSMRFQVSGSVTVGSVGRASVTAAKMSVDGTGRVLSNNAFALVTSVLATGSVGVAGSGSLSLRFTVNATGALGVFGGGSVSSRHSVAASGAMGLVANGLLLPCPAPTVRGIGTLGSVGSARVFANVPRVSATVRMSLKSSGTRLRVKMGVAGRGRVTVA